MYPTKNTGTEEVIEQIRRNALVFGNPERIIVDRVQECCESKDIRYLMIATGVPRGNGQVESIRILIIPMLTNLYTEKPDHWHKYFNRVQKTTDIERRVLALNRLRY